MASAGKVQRSKAIKLIAANEEVEALRLQNFQWLGERGEAASQFGYGVFHRQGFTLDAEDGSRTWELQVGAFASIAMNSREGQQGEVSANSIAQIIGILEDQDGHCWVALHYFWRWGQIHAGADVDGNKQGCPRVTAPTWASEIFIQKPDVVERYYHDSAGHNTVYGPDSTYREVMSAAIIEQPVTVLTYPEVLARYPGLEPPQALEAFTQDPQFAEVEPDSGARRDGFFWRFAFDHTAYTFTFDQDAFGGKIERQYLSESERSMADFFCGAGHVALGASYAGWEVRYGVDQNADAVASFNTNVMDFPGSPFNPPGSPRAFARHCTVEELLQECSNGGAAVPQAGYIHFSPPCQELSARKKQELRRFSGRTLMAIPKLVEALQPAFVTLEEVPGFIIHDFPTGGMLVYQEAARQRHRQQQEQDQLSGTAGGASQDDGCDEEAKDEEDEDLAAAAASGEAFDEAAADLQQLAAASEHAGKKRRGQETFHPCLLVVPQLLSLGYQVRLCMLDCLQYGVPQTRHRVFLFAAKFGYALPEPPRRRYQLPKANWRRIFTDGEGQKGDKPRKARDMTFIVKGDQAGTWWDVLTAAADASQPPDLLPHVTVAEAIGDLPPIIASSSSIEQALGSVQAQGTSWHLEDCSGQLQGAFGSHDSSSSRCYQQQRDQQQQQEQLGDAVLQPQGRLQQALNNLLEAGLEVAEQHSNVKGHQYGLGCITYNPRHGVLLCRLPPAVSDLQPMSVFAQWCRSPHTPWRRWLGFSPLALTGHTYVGPTVTLPTDRRFRIDPCSIVGVICGHNQLQRASMHPVEPRFSSPLERRRFQGMPDWVSYCGPVKSVNQQIGNAVPYPMAIEVAASVFEAATGLKARRPPPLVGPSPQGWGLPKAQKQRYEAWWKDVVDGPNTGWQDVVEGSRAALQAELSHSTCFDAPSQTAAAAAGAASGGSGSKQQQPLESSGGGSTQRRRHRQQQQQQQPVQKSGLQPSTDEELGNNSSQQTKGLTPSKRPQPDEQ